MERVDARHRDDYLDSGVPVRLRAVALCSVVKWLHSRGFWLMSAYIGVVLTTVGLYNINRRQSAHARQVIAEFAQLAVENCHASNQNRAVMRRILADSDRISLRVNAPGIKERIALHKKYGRTLLRARVCPAG